MFINKVISMLFQCYPIVYDHVSCTWILVIKAQLSLRLGSCRTWHTSGTTLASHNRCTVATRSIWIWRKLACNFDARYTYSGHSQSFYRNTLHSKSILLGSYTPISGSFPQLFVLSSSWQDSIFLGIQSSLPVVLTRSHRRFRWSSALFVRQ